jgi:hypothetical protein
MDIERLGLPASQQARVDEQFLSITLATLQQRSSYTRMAWLTNEGGLGDELEAVYVRVLDTAHVEIAANTTEDSEQIPADGEPNKGLSPDIVRSLGILSFIDALQLPSGQELHRKSREPDEHRGLGEVFGRYRRLFVGLSNSDRQLSSGNQ